VGKISKVGMVHGVGFRVSVFGSERGEEGGRVQRRIWGKSSGGKQGVRF